MGFSRFVRRTEISGELVCQTGVRIGTGRGGSVGVTDLPVLRDSRGRPVIPGSSLKGVLRSGVEAVLRAQEGGDALACDRFNKPCLDDLEKAGGADARELDARTRNQRARDNVAKLCVACRAFGAPGLASSVIFSDAALQGDEPPRVQQRDGVAIDRDLGRVLGGLKYDYEVVAAGSRFGFRVDVDPGDDGGWQDGLLALGLDLLDQGFVRVGGGTSRGLGLMRVEGLKVRSVSAAGLLKGVAPETLTWEEFLRSARERLEAEVLRVATMKEGT